MKKNINIERAMFLKSVVFVLCFFIFLFSFFTQKIFAQNDKPLPAITVINSVRGNGLGHENDDLGSSLKAQWQVTQEAQVNATWLLQYGALENQTIIDLARNEMSGQEFGLLFEIDRNYAQKAGVLYRGQGPWYFSDGIFLNSYDVSERRILIDTSFSKFKQVFGYYPKTVGAWWIGGDSLTYMQKKYGITAALRAADQFDLDTYSIWGTPWSIPYIASKTNEAIPAKSFEESSKVVILQWAARDPLEGYIDPLFSLQDYSTKGYGFDYVDYLAGIFLNKSFTNLVMGLENGATLEDFKKGYRPMLLKAKELEKEKKASIVFAKDFARQFLDQGKVFPYTSYFLSEDYDSKDQSFWYISENYRAALHKNNDSIYVVDIRDYSYKIDEDYSVLPNGQPRLRINTPEIVESVRFPENKILLKTTTEPMTLKENNNEVTLFAGTDIIASFTPAKMKLFIGDTTGGKIYDFGVQERYVSILSILSGIYFLYFLAVLFRKKNIVSAVQSFLPLVIPLFFASFFLISESVFLFDKKELILFPVFFFQQILSLSKILIVIKIIPFMILIIAHYFLTIAYPGKIRKTLYYIVLFLITYLYFHIPYFPLDKTTFRYVGSAFVLLTVLLSVSAVYIGKKIVRKQDIYLVVVTVPIVICMLIFTTVYSRSKLALTNYEINALQVIKNSKKDVIYIEQFDNSIRPIYKAVKPLLYNDFQIGQIMTHKKWSVVVRPSNHILKLTDYDNTLIIIPKYLGSDISDYEIDLLKIKKIFDNAQIQIYEKI
jgi:hypothetical protein